MFPEERQALIQLEVQNRGSVSVADLADQFSVSEVTIRSDLQKLSDSGRIVRTHGGAIRATLRYGYVSMASRSKERESEKSAIGRAAAALIGPDEKIMLDAGTTCLQVAANLGMTPGLTCIAVDLAVAARASAWPNVTVILSGGYTRADLQLWGPDCLRTILAHAPVDRSFIGLTGVSLEGGLTQSFPPGVDIKKALIHAAREVIVLADSKKFGVVAPHRLAGLDVVHTIVTDKGAPMDMVEALRDQGIKVVLA